MSENQIVAIVNGKEISKNEVQNFINEIMEPHLAMQFQSPEGMQRVLNEYINQELMYLDAVDSNLEADSDFHKIIEIQKRGLLKNYAINKVVSKATATDDELHAYYEDNKEKYKKQALVQASHILVDDESKANDILTELNGGLDFGEAAKNYSSCSSKEQGGDLGEFSKGQMVAEFDSAAFGMEEGQVSAPVKTQFGYHIIKVTKKTPESISSFEEVEDQVNGEVMRIKQQQVYLDKVNELKGKYEVQIF
ncbi:peptidylprolyl isomerase [Tissierella creatinini]|nr:peptidylprolyl isomerase [Tissierella creatinini]TJX61523.1 peptidylprolyl isomerase [Soehngenia saccharolytica]